jgi:hypothetical protein
MKIFISGASGFIGGTVARRLLDAGYSIRGLVRDAGKAEQLEALGIEPVVGSLEDSDLLVREARSADGVINAADSDHLPAIEALVEGLRGSDKPLLHTSGSSVIGDDARGIKETFLGWRRCAEAVGGLIEQRELLLEAAFILTALHQVPERKRCQPQIDWANQAIPIIRSRTRTIRIEAATKLRRRKQPAGEIRVLVVPQLLGTDGR